MLSKEQFIARHLLSCDAKPCKKYDAKKSEYAYHSLAYSRRKCAKRCWKEYQKRQQAKVKTLTEIFSERL